MAALNINISSAEDLSHAVAAVTAIVAALAATMAILQYKENSKQKAAELLISLESEFRTSILPILVKLEYNELYTNEYDCHLQDVINKTPPKKILAII